MTDYLGRIGNLIRDARKHRGMTQPQLAETLGTSQSAINRIEKGHQNLTLDMLARIGSALDSEIVSRRRRPERTCGSPAARRCPGSDRRQDLARTPAWPCCAPRCSTRGDHGAAQGRPHRGGQPAARGAGPRSGCKTTLAQRRERPRARRPADPRPRRDGRGGRPPHPQHHHVPRPADAPLRRLRAALRRRLRPRHPHRRAAHDRPASLRPQGRRPPRAATTRRSTARVAPERPIVLTERGDTVTENALLAAARHPADGDPQRQRPTTWSRTSASSWSEARRRHRGHRHHDAARHGQAGSTCDVDYAPSEDPIEAMRLIAAAIVTRPSITIRACRSSSWRSSWPCSRRWASSTSRSEEYVAENGHTRLVDLTTHGTPSCTRHSTRSTRCRSRGSTSTTCRSSP